MMLLNVHLGCIRVQMMSDLHSGLLVLERRARVILGLSFQKGFFSWAVNPWAGAYMSAKHTAN